MSVATVTILSEGSAIDPALNLMDITICREFNKIPTAEISFQDGNIATQEFAISNMELFAPGKEIEIKVRYEEDSSSEVSVFTGLVIKHQVEVNQEESSLHILLKDNAFKLTRHRKSAIFNEQTDSAIIEQLIGDGGLEVGEIVETETEHAELIQYHCSDWDFMVCRAEANGLVVSVQDGVISLLKMETNDSVVSTYEFGLTNIYGFEMEADASHQVSGIQGIGWDLPNQQATTPTDATDLTLAQGNIITDDITSVLGDDPIELKSLTPLDPVEIQAWADARMAKYRLSLLRGTLTVEGTADVIPGNMIEILGVSDRFNGETLVSGIKHHISELNWYTAIQFGMSATPFLADASRAADMPASALYPSVNGLQIGIIAPFEEDPLEEFRIKVLIPMLHASDGVVWARLTQPDAGSERGAFFLPEEGDEVVIGFLNDDPRNAIILGSLYSSVNLPPIPAGDISADNFYKGWRTKEGIEIMIDEEKKTLSLLTAEKRKIVLDEDQGAISISDDHNNSLIMNADGITITSSADLNIEASGSIVIKGSEVDIQ